MKECCVALNFYPPLYAGILDSNQRALAELTPYRSVCFKLKEKSSKNLRALKTGSGNTGRQPTLRDETEIPA